ncbi:MAG: hypothetical protein ACE5G0_16880 [Rhodothermales bacterium]
MNPPSMNELLDELARLRPDVCRKVKSGFVISLWDDWQLIASPISFTSPALLFAALCETIRNDGWALELHVTKSSNVAKVTTTPTQEAAFHSGLTEAEAVLRAYLTALRGA